LRLSRTGKAVCNEEKYLFMPVKLDDGGADAAGSAAVMTLAPVAAPEDQDAGLRALLSLARPAEDDAPFPALSGPAAVPARARRRLAVPLPLLVILTVQTVLAGTLLHANTAFQDEALYLWAGRLEIAGWLHGTPIPLYPTYFSGAPILYPPLAALANSIAGLTGARILSLCFMLGATTLLWATTSRLYGRRPAFFAAALWAVLGPTLHLSAFATFDPMSLFLVALAAWFATGSRTREDSTGWILAAAGALVLANVAKYASAIFDPTVIGMAWLSACPCPGGKAAARRPVLLVTCLAGLLAVLVKIGGTYYQTGITQTTLTRITGSNTVAQVLGESWAWIGIVVVAASAGAAIGLARERGRSRKLLLILLAGTGLLAPLQQAHIRTTTSLDKHVDFGAWFAMIAGGYAVDALLTAIRPRVLRAAALGACAVALGAAAMTGLTQARALFAWPNTSKFVAALRPLVDNSTGHLLVETPSIPEYYLPAGTQWKRWSSTWNIVLGSGRSTGSQGVGRSGNSAVFAHYIGIHYFSLIALNFNATRPLDEQIARLLELTPGYHLVARLPYGRVGQYVIWVYKPRPHSLAGSR